MQQTNKFDLEDRTAMFAERIREFCLRLPHNLANVEFIPQLLRSGSSPAGNYIEANDSLGDKDFNMKIKICRREAKEAGLWLRLIVTDNSIDMEAQRNALRQESKELVLIFSAILNKRLKS